MLLSGAEQLIYVDDTVIPYGREVRILRSPRCCIADEPAKPLLLAEILT